MSKKFIKENIKERIVKCNIIIMKRLILLGRNDYLFYKEDLKQK